MSWRPVRKVLDVRGERAHHDAEGQDVPAAWEYRHQDPANHDARDRDPEGLAARERALGGPAFTSGHDGEGSSTASHVSTSTERG